jgi:hypothetical protein
LKRDVLQQAKTETIIQYSSPSNFKNLTMLIFKCLKWNFDWITVGKSQVTPGYMGTYSEVILAHARIQAHVWHLKKVFQSTKRFFRFCLTENKPAV